ncbi:hypothetical protein O181_049518 [Austropuccinia psidii MF-1]|uniref:Uncharacterized protein n=1 Tax=Austropuccinia psidii MF-1 TaxID=1389203 RepID=A0A9Q3E012_9BASI|nr:hypothetical protein [Austropuccinia psidii MF-1]
MIMAEANQLQKEKGQLMTSKLINCVIMKLIIPFYLQKELKPPQEVSVDIYKSSQKADNNSLQHKEYQILADLWKNSMSSYLSVRKFLGNPNTCKLLNGWHPLMAKKNMILLPAEWRENNPPPPKQVPKTAPVASSSNSNVKKQPQSQDKNKGKAPATKAYSQGYIILKIQNSFHNLEPSMGQELSKEVPKLKEWSHFSGEGEYDHMELIRCINMIKEDFKLPDRLV